MLVVWLLWLLINEKHNNKRKWDFFKILYDNIIISPHCRSNKFNYDRF